METKSDLDSSSVSIALLPVLCGRDSPKSVDGRSTLWYILQSRKPPYFYSKKMDLGIDGPLAIKAVTCCMNTLVERHAALQMTFSKTPQGELQKELGQAYPVQLKRIRVGDRSMGDKALEQEIQRVLLEQSQPKTNFLKTPLFSTCLLDLPGSKQAFLLIFQHVIVDIDSVASLLDDWRTVNDAYAKGVEPAPAQMSFQFCNDDVAWQRWIN